MFRRDGTQPAGGGNVARSVVDMPDLAGYVQERKDRCGKSGVHEGRHLHLHLHLRFGYVRCCLTAHALH